MDPKFIPLNRKTIANLFRSEYYAKYDHIKTMLHLLVSKACFTTDGWISGDPYIVVTCHYIYQEFIFISFILDLIHFPHPHDAFNLEAFLKVLKLLFKFIIMVNTLSKRRVYNRNE